MRRKRKIVLWSICLVICMYYLSINYIRYKSNGYNNLLIGIINEFPFMIEVEIFLDGEKMMTDTISYNVVGEYRAYVVNVSPGTHVVQFKIDENVYETEIFVLSVKYLHVEYTGIPKKREGPIFFNNKCTPPFYWEKPKQLLK